jgi:hypothetical protein
MMQDYELTEDEYDAVYDWIQGNMDGLPWPLKEGMLKLINGEMHRRMERPKKAK